MKIHLGKPVSCLAALLLAACGGGSGDEAPGPPGETPALSVEGEVTVVRLTGNDRMKYNLDRFEVVAGRPVRLVFENIGRMPRTTMGHNVVILHEGLDPMAYALEAAKAKDEDYMPVALSGRVLAHTRLLGPGETDTVEFTAPEPGAYPYLCSFPAHAVAGMRGVMTVTPRAD